MNGTGVRLAKETTRVWLLLPERPTTVEEELSLLEEQWKNQYSWWVWWLWWLFCWRNGQHFKRLSTSPQKIGLPIDELNRLLGGDARCSLYSLIDDSLDQAVHHLAPKSVIHLFPISTFPSKWEMRQINKLEHTLHENGHSIHWIDRPSRTEPWLEMKAQWIRYNVLTQSENDPINHIVLFMRRQLEHWNGFTNTADKQRHLLEQELSRLFPTCTVQVLLNAPIAKDTLDSIPNRERIFYGFIDSVGTQEDILHPDLTRPNLMLLQPHPESIYLLRMLRQHIWDYTGCAP